MVQDGKDDLVHVLPQPEVDLLLLLEGFHELEGTRKQGQRPGRGPGCGRASVPTKPALEPGHQSLVSHPGRGKGAEVQATPPERPVSLARWGGAQTCAIVLLKAENAWPEACIIRSDT